jgi:hypothetical protein
MFPCLKTVYFILSLKKNGDNTIICSYNYVCCCKYTAQISEIPKDKTIPGKFQYCARFHGDFVKKHK